MPKDMWPSLNVPQGTHLYPIFSSGREIDLRQEFLDLIDGTALSPQRGHWVLLRRMERSQRCSCWKRMGEGDSKYMDDNRKYNEPGPDCAICGGEGWLYAEELHKVRRRIVTPVQGAGELDKQEDFGVVNIPYIVYYFKHYVRPTEHDRIIEIDNNSSGNPVRPIVKRNLYSIALAEPFRDLNGRIEYWRCVTRKEDIRYGRTMES